MTDADLPTPPSDNDAGPPESHSLPDIDKLFPILPQSEFSPLDDQDDQDDQAETEEQREKERFESISSDDTGDTVAPHSPADDADEDSEETASLEPAGPSAVVRYGLMGFLGEFRYKLKRPVRPGNKVVVRTDRGVELGDVVTLVNRPGANGTDDESPAGSRISSNALDQFLKTSSENYPFRRGGRVLRIANQQDLIDFRHLHSSASEESKYCKEQIQKRNLPMRLVKAEHMLGGERIVFYFTAESRVDFRSLVRDLASQFRTRIEMRQVGARDEARLVADYERCGRPCCCREFLKDLKPVSMRMAKVQKATLDPTKISGRCGRLMCCLRYEDECYEELKKTLPKRNTWVRTKMYLGCVVDGQIITQLVRLALYDGTFVVVPVEDILERNLPQPTEEELRDHAVKQAAAQRNEARKAAEAEAAALAAALKAHESRNAPAMDAPTETPAADGGEAPADPTKKKRRRGRRKKPAGDAKTQPAKNETEKKSSPQSRDKGNNAQSSGSDGQKKSPRRRRGRRRGKKPDSGGQSGGQNAPGGSNGGA
jgi:cell fate regulator YaaT (PSP1 superfamily)